MLKELWESIAFPTEISSMFRLKYGGYMSKPSQLTLQELAHSAGDLEFCYAVLNVVSRSFAVVIQQLPEQLKDAVCIFYLVLRGLDSVEDDMTYPVKDKLELLLSFDKKLTQDGWHIMGVGDTPDYRTLLANFEKVIRVYKSLKPAYQHAIADITRRMGRGMAEYVTKEGSIDTVANYNLYCHYVAGLVGYGLSTLFSVSGLEDPSLQSEERISNSMGLFLQKTNIIRDYLEDLDAGRTWWPEQIWSQYGKNLECFKENPDSLESLGVLNHLVTDALAHVPDCLDYLSRLQDKKIFEFCAIPQVMAIATLAQVYDNSRVFTGVVKIRKGLSCKLMLHSSNLQQVHNWFYTFADKIAEKIRHKTDPNAKRTHELITLIKTMTRSSSHSIVMQPQVSVLRWCNYVAWIIFMLASIYLLSTVRARSIDGEPTISLNLLASKATLDYAAVVGLFCSVGYLFGFFGVQYV